LVSCFWAWVTERVGAGMIRFSVETSDDFIVCRTSLSIQDLSGSGSSELGVNLLRSIVAQ
jgi:hypothetical protein